jgi:hypothetical protein
MFLPIGFQQNPFRCTNVFLDGRGRFRLLNGSSLSQGHRQHGDSGHLDVQKWVSGVTRIAVLGKLAGGT